MIDWLWLLPVIGLGILIGAMLSRKFERGFGAGILAALAAMFFID